MHSKQLSASQKRLPLITLIITLISINWVSHAILLLVSIKNSYRNLLLCSGVISEERAPSDPRVNTTCEVPCW